MAAAGAVPVVVVDVGLVIEFGGHGRIAFGSGSFELGGMGECVGHDVLDVLIAQRVPLLLADTGGADQPRAPQHLEVLRHGRLGDLQRVDQLVHAPVAVGELADDPNPTGVCQRLEERSRCFRGVRLDEPSANWCCGVSAIHESHSDIRM